MKRDIRHNPSQSRFEWTEEGLLSQLTYTLRDQVMTITHTGVPPPIEGRGIAADLTRHALDTARENGWKVNPVCSYAVVYIKRYPQYQDLLA